MAAQVIDASSRWRGATADAYGLYGHGAVGGTLAVMGTAYLYPSSRHHGRAEVFARMRLAVDFLQRNMSADGNILLPVTNFNSPPDTAFMVAGIAPLLLQAQQVKSREVQALMEPLLERCGRGLVKGGMHTPNHRWVACSALAQLHEVMPRPEYVRRAEQWLAEGIDIDGDGQFTERSTSVYDPIVDRALVVAADKLRKPELLDPVRRNLESLLYLLHPNGEVVTEISRRQDAYQRGRMLSYWFPLQYMAVHDKNGMYATLAAQAAPQAMGLAVLLEYPELLTPVVPKPCPDNYEKHFKELGIARIRRGATSATLVLGGRSRFLTLRRGEAVVTAVRFASAFFGKGQFIPAKTEKSGPAYVFTQQLSAGYYQPLDPPRKIAAGEFDATRHERKVTELCTLRQWAIVTEESDGFSVRIQASGTNDVPLAIEIAFAAEGTLEGCEPVHADAGAFLMQDEMGSFRAGGDVIRFGPKLRQHSYLAMRGAEARIPGQQCVYLTALTPVDHTLRFRWA